MKGATSQCLRINFCNENNLAMYLVYYDKFQHLPLRRIWSKEAHLPNLNHTVHKKQDFLDWTIMQLWWSHKVIIINLIITCTASQENNSIQNNSL